MKSKKILVLIIIALIVALFANMMIIKSKKLSLSKIENEKEIVTEINNTDDEGKEDTEVIAVENNVEEQEKVEEIQQEADIVNVKNTNIQEEPKKDPVVTQEKKVVQTQNFKNNLVTTKERLNEFTSKEENTSAENYASNHIQNDISYLSRKGATKSNEIGKKSLENTKQNIIKSKEKISNIKSKIKQKKAQQIKNAVKKRTIKNGTQKSIKYAKNGAKLTKKGIKTSEQVAKNSAKVAKQSFKASKRAIMIAKRTAQLTIKAVKVTVKATIATIKAIIAATKAIISAIVAGGWVAVVIILVIALIGGFVAAIFNSNGDADYDTSQIPNSEIVLVAKAQIGNEGGDKFWKWYGFEEHVHWCACFVSWCANECGYIDKGIIPKFAGCVNGIEWFKEKEQWHDRGESYYPIVGDIIFFDWKDENGNQDGTSDHVGIVTRTDITNRNIYTIEGNTSNKCAERMYSFDDVQVMGYGSPKYE